MGVEIKFTTGCMEIPLCGFWRGRKGEGFGGFHMRTASSRGSLSRVKKNLSSLHFVEFNFSKGYDHHPCVRGNQSCGAVGVIMSLKSWLIYDIHASKSFSSSLIIFPLSSRSRPTLDFL